jgi:predicted chitinase
MAAESVSARFLARVPVESSGFDPIEAMRSYSALPDDHSSLSLT